MKNKDCNRRTLIIRELIHDWDELNIAFKSLIIVGMSLLVVVISIAFFSDGGTGIQNSLEVVFRSTLASVFGFLLSSSIKSNTRKKNAEIERIQSELKQIQEELESIGKDNEAEGIACNIQDNYTYKDINIVQIIIALSICVIAMLVICILLITDNLENVPAISQIRDLMCSSIGFLIGESGKK